jgi:hypothetical protein
VILVHVVPHVHPQALLITGPTACDDHTILRHQRRDAVLDGRSSACIRVKSYPHRRVLLHCRALTNERVSERRELCLCNLCIITGSDAHEIRAVAITHRAVVHHNPAG